MMWTFSSVALVTVVNLITVWPAFCRKIRNQETRTAELFLGQNGEVDSMGVPSCDPGKRIHLKSYVYNEMECTRVECSPVHEEALSESTVFQLHQNCSLRQTCENLNFHVPTSVDSDKFPAVTIQYRCIDADKSILDMCEKHEINFTDTLYLAFEQNKNTFTECQCWVNRESFSIKLLDLRLKHRNRDQCSDAKLVINKRHYTCDPRSKRHIYGALFNTMFDDNLPLDAIISLVPGAAFTPPEMVWIALIPEGTSRLQCLGDRTPIKSTTGDSSTTTTTAVSTTTATTTTTSSQPTSSVDTPRIDVKMFLIIVLSVVVVILVAAIFVLVLRVRRLRSDVKLLKAIQSNIPMTTFSKMKRRQESGICDADSGCGVDSAFISNANSKTTL